MTQTDLDMYAAVECDAASGRSTMHRSLSQLVSMQSPMLLVMAACHSLSLIDEQLCGDPMELKMFNSLHWRLIEPDTAPDTHADVVGVDMPCATIVSGESDSESESAHAAPYEVGIVRPFPFIAELQCMSTVVVVRKAPTEHNGHLLALTKGAPEKIASICKPETGMLLFR